MSLPIRATSDDIQQTCDYLATKPTGAEINEISGVLGSKFADHRRLGALSMWGLVEHQEDGKWKVTARGRQCLKDGPGKTTALREVIRTIPAYLAVLERASHRSEDSLTSTEVASHWHEHFKDEVGDSDDGIKQQAICFFQLVESSGLGSLVVGRRGAETRLSFNVKALGDFAKGIHVAPQAGEPGSDVDHERTEVTPASAESDLPPRLPPSVAEGTAPSPPSKEEPKRAGQGIFVAHGKNKKPLAQLKQILEGFKIPYKVAIDEPNLGRPIGSKLRDIMESCNCAILIFTADEEFKDTKGNTVWRSSENVVHELGASGYLYDNRIVIMKEDEVSFPSNFRDLGYISFEKDRLDTKAMDVLQELIGLRIVKVST